MLNNLKQIAKIDAETNHFLAEELNATMNAYCQDMVFMQQIINEERKAKADAENRLTQLEKKLSQYCKANCKKIKQITICLDDPDEYMFCRQKFINKLQTEGKQK